MYKILRKPTCILLSLIIIFHMSTIYAISTQTIMSGEITWNISIGSICESFTNFKIRDIFDLSKYTYDYKDGIFVDLDFAKIGVNLKEGKTSDNILNHIFINLLKDIRRIGNNMNIFNYVERRKL